MMDEYTYGVPQKYDPNSRMLARKVDKVQHVTNVSIPIIQPSNVASTHALYLPKVRPTEHSLRQ